MQEITISHMTMQDLNQVCEIEKSVFPDPWSLHMFEEELRLPELYNLIAIHVNDELVAYGGILTIHDESHVTNLAVKPEYQSKGIGTVLLGELIKLAVLKKAKNLSLEVRTDNNVAQKLYKNFDLLPIAIRKHYYGYDEDALIMSAEEIDQPNYLEKVEKISRSKVNSRVISEVSTNKSYRE